MAIYYNREFCEEDLEDSIELVEINNFLNLCLNTEDISYFQQQYKALISQIRRVREKQGLTVAMVALEMDIGVDDYLEFEGCNRTFGANFILGLMKLLNIKWADLILAKNPKDEIMQELQKINTIIEQMNTKINGFEGKQEETITESETLRKENILLKEEVLKLNKALERKLSIIEKKEMQSKED